MTQEQGRKIKSKLLTVLNHERVLLDHFQFLIALNTIPPTPDLLAGIAVVGGINPGIKIAIIILKIKFQALSFNYE